MTADDAIALLEAQVLELPPHQRARLLEKLIASLDADDGMEAAWDAVAAARANELATGAVKPVPHDEVMARLRAEFDR